MPGMMLMMMSWTSELHLKKKIGNCRTSTWLVVGGGIHNLTLNGLDYSPTWLSKFLATYHQLENYLYELTRIYGKLEKYMS